jgi:diaminopimelate epimerase
VTTAQYLANRLDASSRLPRVAKAHAYGNDFLLLDESSAAVADPAALARAMCHRHLGIGADGLILFSTGPASATMRLWNADGSPSELSGNGLRCLAALVAREQGLGPGSIVTVATGAGTKTLEILRADGSAYEFRAQLGRPTDVRQTEIDVNGERITATVLGMGNPQCVVLGPLPDPGRFAALGPALSTHPRFPAGTNVEFAHVEAPDRVRILIWERGVGPTTSSGTGTAASAVAAIAHGGAARRLTVVAPGGSQTVEWAADGVSLTGSATVLMDGVWTGGMVF